MISKASYIEGLIDVIPSPVIVKNRDHKIIMLNCAACAFFGYSRETILSTTDFDLFPAEQVHVFHAADDRVFESGEIDEIEEQVTNGDGALRTVITRKKRVTIGQEDFLVASLTDVTEYREAEARNRYIAFHDALTGLPNRMLLNERIEQAILRMPRGCKGGALIYVDLDRFKEVNDTLGHQAGDQLICQFAERISAIVRASDTVARLGGDEFAILLHDAGDGVDAEEICKRVLDAAGQAFELAQGRAHVGASLGIVHLDEMTRVELHRRADVALYQAKRDGRGCYRTFSDELDAGLRKRRAMEADLRAALATGQEIAIHYQPLFSVEGNRVVAFEALVRWQHPRLGLLAPADFLDIAEESGLIVQLGGWVLERACSTLADWPEVSLAVNLSPVQLGHDELIQSVLAVLARTNFDPARLQLEVTEHTMLDLTGAVEKLRQLRSLGIKIVLDDFGTGYSSLSHLQKIEIDKVKIDRSFVQDMREMNDSRAIVQAVATLGSSLGIAVTAEGVETEEQRAFLHVLGCQELQGFLLSGPMAEEETVNYLQQFIGNSKAA